jgi:hypothetical protein
MLVTPGGSFRGHCGEVDARGRVYSGHPADEEVRTSAAWLAERARERGFFGPCGVDAFSYASGQQLPAGRSAPESGDERASQSEERDDRAPPEAREPLRTGLEFNARPTMGLVTLGLVRRALPIVREAIGLAPDNRRAFLFSLLARDPGASRATEARAAAIETDAGPGSQSLSWGREVETEGPVPVLFFGADREQLRAAHRRHAGC